MKDSMAKVLNIRYLNLFYYVCVLARLGKVPCVACVTGYMHNRLHVFIDVRSATFVLSILSKFLANLYSIKMCIFPVRTQKVCV